MYFALYFTLNYPFCYAISVAVAMVFLECSMDVNRTEMFIRADVYCYGNTVAYCAFGVKPWNSDSTEVINEADWDSIKAKIALPQQRAEDDPLTNLIVHCYDDEPENRPKDATVIIQNYFSGQSRNLHFILKFD